MSCFNIFLQEVYKQLELDFRNIPKWAKALEGDWDNVFKKKYYPIKNMQKNKQRDAAFKRFWMSVISSLKNKKYTEQQIIDMDVPEYMFHLYH